MGFFMLYVVRHGQTNWNLENKIQGQADIPLNDVGIKQAYTLKALLKDVSFKLVISSPLSRARDTAKILCNSSSHLILDNRIIERDFGEFEGLSKDDFDSSTFWNYKANCKYKKAETVNILLDRVYDFLNEYKQIYETNNVLVVTHAGVIPAIGCYFNGIPKNNDLFTYHCKNCEILKF